MEWTLVVAPGELECGKRRVAVTLEFDDEQLIARRSGGAEVHLRFLERAKGIEPSYAAWEAAVLPLNYARKLEPKSLFQSHLKFEVLSWCSVPAHYPS